MYNSKGTRKYKCGVCLSEAMYHWVEKNRANGLRCVGCGSRDLTIVTKEGKEDAAEKQTVRVLKGTHSTTDERSTGTPRNKKVT